VLEYSHNIPDQFKFKDFFEKLHQLMVNTGAFKLERIKSRLVPHDNFYIGNGNTENTFVYLQISILTGREVSLRKHLSSAALELLKEYFPKTLATNNCSMTVDIREMDREVHSSLN
jgi:5-carboxymethyl-2-hydroxymuconate isomerase